MREFENTQTTIDILRHGEPTGGIRFRGITDDPLSEVGWQQMLECCDNRNWQAVISSPLQRCQAVALHLSATRNIPLYVDAAWQEIDFGRWEGLTAEAIEHRYPKALEAYYRDFMNASPPEGETYKQFSTRVNIAWYQLTAAYFGQSVLLITHAGVIRALFSLLMGISPENSFRIEVPHASLTRFRCFGSPGKQTVLLDFHNR
ncbi:histidine phosphatase family protein [Methylomonas sp. HYX-M1]|uniref:histidine phosphatase family protein n=1 Tax=Methylomonas sp. HYX-M1 TaxID=3139307 RepID=UPI00345BFE82